jgi:hypothetical protein
MKVSAPGVAEKRTTVREANTSAPFVRSSTTSYEWVSTIARRSCASLRVRFSPGTALLPWVRVGELEPRLAPHSIRWSQG